MTLVVANLFLWWTILDSVKVVDKWTIRHQIRHQKCLAGWLILGFIPNLA